MGMPAEKKSQTVNGFPTITMHSEDPENPGLTLCSRQPFVDYPEGKYPWKKRSHCPKCATIENKRAQMRLW